MGYSWDENYNIGDNLIEGLLLSFDTSFTPDWQGYSLDGGATKTILGNTTIPIPTEDGLHTVQVFGTDSTGTSYQSSVRSFSNSMMVIETPANTTYFAPMAGYYPATYGFESDDVESNPTEWTVRDSSGITTQVISEIGGHKNVIEINDFSGTDYAEIYNTISRTAGTVEFWVRVAQSNTGSFTFITDNNYRGVHFYFLETGYFTYFDGGYHNIEAYNINQWYHIKIEFDTNDWHLWIDEVQKDSGVFSFYSSPSSFTKVGFSTWHPGSGYFYIDAVGYSWDSNYDIGDNLDEGLLFSFITADSSFEWLRYSLDGQANVTVIGDTVLTMPTIGLHTIQLFGTDSIGTVLQSEKRYFTVS